MNFLFAGEASPAKGFISKDHQSMIARAINIAPLVLSCICGLISIGTVSMFRTASNIVDTPSQDMSVDADGTIAVLLGMLFATEVGTRLFAVSNACSRLRVLSSTIPQEWAKFFTNLSTRFRENDHLVDRAVPKTEFSSCGDFMNTLYDNAALNTLENETHLRWVLFDLVLFYHTVIRAYVLSGDPTVYLSNIAIFTAIFSRSYMHFFVIMLMFSTSESIYTMYHDKLISNQIPVPSSHVYKCVHYWRETSTVTIPINDDAKQFKRPDKVDAQKVPKHCVFGKSRGYGVID